MIKALSSRWKLFGSWKLWIRNGILSKHELFKNNICVKCKCNPIENNIRHKYNEILAKSRRHTDRNTYTFIFAWVTARNHKSLVTFVTRSNSSNSRAWVSKTKQQPENPPARQKLERILGRGCVDESTMVCLPLRWLWNRGHARAYT